LVEVSCRKNSSFELSIILTKTSTISKTRVCLARLIFLCCSFNSSSSGVCSYSMRSRQVNSTDLPAGMKSLTEEMNLSYF